MSKSTGPKIVIIDAFGGLLDVGQVVVYAGTDHKRRPTLNLGEVEEVQPGKVLVLRRYQSTRRDVDATSRRVWVEAWKVTGVTHAREAA